MTVRKLLVAALACLVVVRPLAVYAEDDTDHDLARDLYEQGKIKALSDILKAVTGNTPGDIVSVDLVRINDQWIYRIQVVTLDGRRVSIDVDAGRVGSGHGGIHQEGRE